MGRKIVLGTRGSDLARMQTAMATDRLQKRWDDLQLEIRHIRTQGDEGEPGVKIADLGGRKGLFTAEIEKALLAGEIDAAVHSAKDLPSEMSPALEIAAVLPRGPVNDVLIGTTRRDLRSLPQAGTVATGSIRRKYQLRWKRPDLNVVDLRGNVPTRLRKLAEKGWDAIVLAQAGLERLGVFLERDHIRCEGRDFFANKLSPEIFLPAGGQGAIAIQIRKDDMKSRKFVEVINDFSADICLKAEREFLRLLGADCNQPVGVLAQMDSSNLKISAQIFSEDATDPKTAAVIGAGQDAVQLAAELLETINGT